MVSKMDFSVFSEKLKAMRKKRKLTQEQLSEEIGVSKKTVIAWEKGGDITVSNIVSLCNALSCDLGYFFGEYEEDTKYIKKIKEITGLSDNAIDFFIGNKMADEELRQEYCKIINAILENLSFQESLDWIKRAIETKDARGIKIAKNLKECSIKGISLEDTTENVNYHKNLAKKIKLCSELMNVENLDYKKIQDDIIFLSEFAPDITVLSREETAELHLQKAEKLFREVIEKIYKEG